MGLMQMRGGELAWWNFPTCIGGDFNVVRFATERSSGGRLIGAMEEYSDFIRENMLVDLLMIGETYLVI